MGRNIKKLYEGLAYGVWTVRMIWTMVLLSLRYKTSNQMVYGSFQLIGWAVYHSFLVSCVMCRIHESILPLIKAAKLEPLVYFISTKIARKMSKNYFLTTIASWASSSLELERSRLFLCLRCFFFFFFEDCKKHC